MKVKEHAICGFNNAFGLVLVFTNSVCPYGGERTEKNFKLSGLKFRDTFDKMGYAHFVFHDCSKLEFVKIIEELSKFGEFLPKSYQSIIIYFAGYGIQNYIGLRDGFISVHELFKGDNSKVGSITKLLCLDCVKTGNVSELERGSSVENVVIINFLDVPDNRHHRGIGVCTLTFLEIFDNIKGKITLREFIDFLSIQLQHDIRFLPNYEYTMKHEAFLECKFNSL